MATIVNGVLKNSRPKRGFVDRYTAANKPKPFRAGRGEFVAGGSIHVSGPNAKYVLWVPTLLPRWPFASLAQHCLTHCSHS